MQNVASNSPSRHTLYSGFVWLFAAVALTVYGIMGLSNANIPGVEELVTFLSKAEGTYIYIAAFVSICIEGLYVIGSFFPGATMVMILAILAEANGMLMFWLTILTIYIGWCLAGAANIFFATYYREKVAKLAHEPTYEIKDRPWVTWFPSFRANYEVAQIVEGGKPRDVFFSSVRVRFFASLGAALFAYLMAIIIDINELSNEEGFMSVMVVATIQYTVAIIKIRKYRISSRSLTT